MLNWFKRNGVELGIVLCILTIIGWIAIPALLHPKSAVQQIRTQAVPVKVQTGSQDIIPDLENSKQLIVVQTIGGWNGIHGLLRRYERSTTNRPWHQVGRAAKVVVGRSGMGWTTGSTGIIYSDNPVGGPYKVEGDGRSPAGIFTLTTAFSPNESAHRYIKIPFQFVDQNTQCVDDEKSVYYDTIVQADKVTKDYDSNEFMLRHDNLYDFGFFLNNNPTHKHGSGSCVFMHISSPLSRVHGTAGCTALWTADEMYTIFDWVDKDKTPILIQMPREAYRATRAMLNHAEEKSVHLP